MYSFSLLIRDWKEPFSVGSPVIKKFFSTERRFIGAEDLRFSRTLGDTDCLVSLRIGEVLIDSWLETRNWSMYFGTFCKISIDKRGCFTSELWRKNSFPLRESHFSGMLDFQLYIFSLFSFHGFFFVVKNSMISFFGVTGFDLNNLPFIIYYLLCFLDVAKVL